MTARRVAYVLGTTDGGTGRHVAMLADGCVRAGLGVRVVGPAQARALLRIEQADDGASAPGPVDVTGRAVTARAGSVRFDAVDIASSPHPAHDTATVRRLRRLLAGMRPDVVHAHGMRAGALAALALRPYPAARWPGGSPPPLVVTVHNAAPGSTGRAMVYAALERLVARRADAVLCVSADLAARMRTLGAREVGRAVVPAFDPAGPSAANWPVPVAAAPASAPARVPAGTAPTPGTASESSAQAAADSPDTGPAAADDLAPDDLSSEGRPVVLAAGRLADQKGFDTLLAAAARWRDRRPEPILVIAGTGPLAGVLASQARQLEVTVRFLGRRDDVAQLLAVADAFVLPSRWEGQPLILQEALRAARPIIATDVGGVRDLTGDDAVLLVRPGDPAALASAVLRVLDDRELAAALARAAAARAAELPTQADATASVLALYDRLVRHRQHAGPA